ncbi:HAD family hydrolase [Orrella marina]|nr:HAD family hydrolase [Orrella marina]
MSTIEMRSEIGLSPLFLREDVEGVVFDLDGTLIDSAADILGGIREAFLTAGFGQVPDDYFPDNLHGTSDGIMRDIMRDMGWPVPDDLSEIKAVYYDVYARRGHASTRLYPDVQTLLQVCRDTLPEVPMAICTNKVHRNAMAVTQILGITPYFSVISGADSWGQAKPSPVPLLETIREMGVSPEKCLYFGDTSVDAECAERAGVRFVLHESGYGDPALEGMSRFHAFRQWRELLST